MSESDLGPRLTSVSTDLPQERKTGTHSHQPNYWISDFLLLGVALIWGVNIPLMKFCLDRLDPYCFNAYRLTMSAIVLFFCDRLERKIAPPLPTDNERQVTMFRLIGYSLLTGFVYQLLFLVGVDRTTSGNTALLISTMPMWTALLAHLVGQDRLRVMAWAGLAVTFMGTLLVIVPKGSFSWSDRHMTGNLVILVAAVAWAGGTVLSRPMLAQISPTRLALIACVSTLPLHFLVASSKIPGTIQVLGEGPVLAIVIYSGVFSTGLAYLMWNMGVRRVGASHASIFQNLVPAVALITGWWILSEAVVWVQIVGGGLIVGGLVLMRSYRSQS